MTVVFALRSARMDDIPALQLLIDASVRKLQAGDYTSSQIDGALETVFGVDTQLISDGCYFVVQAGAIIVACGGWSKRKTLFGSDRYNNREDALLDPLRDAAKIRAFFVHPDWARKGLGSLLLNYCEGAAAASGFTRFELGATLTGVDFYSARGYAEAGRMSVPLGNGETLEIVRMEKRLRP